MKRSKLDGLLGRRILNSIELLIGVLPEHKKMAALECHDLKGFLIELAEGVLDATDDARLKKQISAARLERRLAQAAGGLLDAADVQALMGYSTKRAVYKAVGERRILAVVDGGRRRFPLCQFEDGRVLAGVRAILKAVPNTDGWKILQYLYDEDELAGVRPIDLIKGSQSDWERAVCLAHRLDP